MMHKGAAQIRVGPKSVIEKHRAAAGYREYLINPTSDQPVCNLIRDALHL
jgi:hypothetical protein